MKLPPPIRDSMVINKSTNVFQHWSQLKDWKLAGAPQQKMLLPKKGPQHSTTHVRNLFQSVLVFIGTFHIQKPQQHFVRDF